MNKTIYVIFKIQFDFALEVWFSIVLSLFILLECSNVDDCKNRNLFLTAKLLKQGYRYHKIRKFYHRHSELIVKYNIGLKTLLQHGISEPIF